MLLYFCITSNSQESHIIYPKSKITCHIHLMLLLVLFCWVCPLHPHLSLSCLVCQEKHGQNLDPQCSIWAENIMELIQTPDKLGSYQLGDESSSSVLLVQYKNQCMHVCSCLISYISWAKLAVESVSTCPTLRVTLSNWISIV